MQLTKTIVNAININKKCLTLFLDLRKAFDTIDPLLLLSKLQVIGVRGITLEVFRSYLSNRQQCTKINEAISDPLAVTRGVPQGTVLGPTLFLIYINNLLKLQTNAEIISYADDTAVLFVGDSWNEVYHNAANSLKYIKNWLSVNLLSLNIEKTRFLTFSTTEEGQPNQDTLVIHKNCCDATQNCDCPIIERANTIKYLGIMTDHHLKWKEHVIYLNKRLRRLFH